VVAIDDFPHADLVEQGLNGVFTVEQTAGLQH
jgi:hypothetical protein